MNLTGLALTCTADQQEVIKSNARFMTLIACRRWGKTFVTRYRILRRCLERPFTKYMYIAPTYSQLLQEYESLAGNHCLHDFFARKPREKPFPHIQWYNGSVVDYRSFERPKNIRSRGYHEIWVDEIQDVNQYDFDSVLMPMIREARGNLGISGQFRGHNWYYEKFFLPGQPGPKHDTYYKSWVFNTSRALIYQGKRGQEELTLARSQTPANIWRVEYECDPGANDKAAFPPEQVDALQTDAEPPAEYNRAYHYIMGLDLGRVRDPSAYIVLCFDTGEIVDAGKLPLGMEHQLQAKRAADVARKWNALVVADTTGGATGGHAKPDEYVRHYRQAIPDMRAVQWAWQNKDRMVETLALEIERRTFSIPRKFQSVTLELKGYEAEYKGGRWIYNAGDGYHDDYVAALAMAIWAKKSGWLAAGGQSMATGLL